MAEEKNKKRDGFWSVYFLPKENYYGCTAYMSGRMAQHRGNGKNVEGWIIVKTFKNKKRAFAYETHMQLTNNANGYIFTKEWREKASSRQIENGDVWLYNKRRKPILCITTGIKFDGVRDCERKLNPTTGNLSKHLNGKLTHTHISGMKFKYL